MTDQRLLDELLEIERAGWRSLCESTGERFYGELMTNDALMVMANGAVLDREAVMAALAGAPPWRAFEFSDPRLIDAGSDTVALVYRGSAQHDVGSEPFVAAMTSVYRRTDGGWRLALYQQTAGAG